MIDRKRLNLGSTGDNSAMPGCADIPLLMRLDERRVSLASLLKCKSE